MLVAAVYLFTAIESLIFSVVMYYCSCKSERKIYKLVMSAVYTFIVLFISNGLLLPHIVKATIVFVLLIVFCALSYKKKLYMVTFITIAIFYLNIMADLIVGNLASGIYHQSIISLYRENIYIFVLSGLIVRVIQALLSILLVKYFTSMAASPSKSWLQLDVALFTSYFLSVAFINVNPELQTIRNPFIILLALLGFLFLNGITIVLFAQMAKYHETKVKIVMTEAILDKVQKEVNNVQDIHEEFSRIKHEWNNHMATLSLMLGESQFIEAQEYVESMSLRIPSIKFIEFTNNKSVDFILNAKITMAEKQNVRIAVSGSSLSDCTIPAEKIISVISNLLDNAIEAVLPLPEALRIIKVRCKTIKDYLYICLENPFNHSIIEKDGMLETNKQNRLAHGYGLSIVEDICKAQNGSLIIRYENDTFTVTATMLL